MTESNGYTIEAAAWRRALIDVKRAILDAEPVTALERIDRMLDTTDRQQMTAAARRPPP